MFINSSNIEISHLSAYAEDPRSYCYYKGIPRSIHIKNNPDKNIYRKNPLFSSFSRNSLYLAILCLTVSAMCLYIYFNIQSEIVGITLDKDLISYTSIGSFLTAITLLVARYISIRHALFKFCEASISNYRLIGTNLSWLKRSMKLRKDKLYGNPGTVFVKKNGKTAYLCQYNPRTFNGRPKVRERYQMLLLMGIAMEEFQTENIKGAIRYRDHLEPIKYEPVIYKKLLALQEEFNEAIQEWEAPDNQPLFKRDKTF